MKIGKKSGKIKPGDVIAVRWIDANSPRENGWLTVEEFVADSPKMEIVSVGFFVKRQKKYLRMAGERSTSKTYVDVVNRVFNIPVGCIRGVEKPGK